MRFLTAAALFVASIILLLIGVAQRTIWAPAPNFSISIEADQPQPYLVIPNSILSIHPGDAIVEAAGTKNIVIASGRESDIKAWVGSASRTTVTIPEKSTMLTAVNTVGLRVTGNPDGSDLWRNQAVSKRSFARLATSSLESGAVLIASDGTKPAPNKVTIIWPVYYDLTPSNILLIIGGVLLLGALIFNWLGYRHLRNKNGPRRKMYQPPKPPKYKFKSTKSNTRAKGRRSARNAIIAVPASLLILSMVAGCAPNTTPQESESPSASAADVPPAAVTQRQLNRILQDIARVSTEADSSADDRLLADRFAGPALQIRGIHYKLMKRSSKVAALPAIVASPVTFSLPAATETWPRTVMAVTDEVGDSALPQMLVLQQASPRDNYQVWYYVRLMPGAKIPAVPAHEIGSIPVDSKSLFLKLPPLKLPAAYGDVINNGQSSLSASLFDLTADEFFKQVSQSQKDQVKNLTTANIKFIHRLGDTNVQALSTSAAGALVVVYMADIYQIKPKTQGSAVAVTGQEKLLLGVGGSTRGVRSQYGDMLLFYVPALSGNAKIRLLGATQGLVSVRSL